MKYNNFINGNWVEPSSGNYKKSINPANFHEVVGEFADSSVEDVDAAVESASNALFEWKNLTSPERGNLLFKVADEIEKRAEDIAKTACLEMGKTLAETTGETARAVAILRYYAGEGMQPSGDVIPSQASGNFLYTKREPLGVVAIISPWNFPIAIPMWKMAPALIYGNTVVIKPASETALTMFKIIEAFEAAGFPKGVINAVTGSGSVVGDYLVKHEKINAITFTGSNTVGKNIALSAVERGKKYQLEMGGKNPVVVLDDADLEQAVKLTMDGAFKHTGQKCTATSRVYVQEGVYDQFKEMLLEKMKDIKIGPGQEPETYMGPLASKTQHDTVLDYIAKGKKEGAKLLVGGKVPEGKEFENGYYVEATVFEDVSEEMSIGCEEIFGPVIALSMIKNLDEGLERSNNVNYGLSASVFTTNLKSAHQFVNNIEAGLIKVNGESAGVELQAPFGGMKESSSHSREQGKAAIEFFTEIKTITMTV